MVAQTTIQSPSSNYSVNFEGIIGNGYQGDIAIDDVSVVSGTCTLPGTVIQVLNVCENVKKNDCCRLICDDIQQPIQFIDNTTLLSSNHTIYFSGNCDFEAGTLCSWVNLQNDDFDWLVGSGGTTSSFTGPTMDHTINQDNSGKTAGNFDSLIFLGVVPLGT